MTKYKGITYDEAMKLLLKEKNGETLTDIERYKFNNLMGALNEVLAEHRADVATVNDYLMNKIPRTAMVEACVTTLIGLMQTELKVEIKDGEQGDAIIGLFNSAMDRIMPEAVLKCIEKGDIVDVSGAKAK